MGGVYFVFFMAGKFKEIAASSDLASSLCPHLSSPDRLIQIQALRAVGNLCSDEGIVTTV